ncbi:unnamed protein product [Linum tenue]|uniref:S-protein homolog n=1 Tax=Linum tenue TaxID=586396 RepID=A0AAV0IHT3_9ROSI|nr:unnamed protein product [Linum tenue]
MRKLVISNKLRVGVVLAAALLVMAARPTISTKGSVYIENSLPTSEVTAICQSKDDDIGRHDIAVGDSISWSFRNNPGWSETLFWCDLNATDYGVLSFDAYRGKKAKIYNYHYFWFVEEDGVYVQNQYGIVETLPTMSWGKLD